MVPGGQIEQLVTRHDRVLAIIERGGARHGRWLELGDGGLAWGRATRALPIGRERAALSPDGARLFGTASLGDGGTPAATVLSLATGEPIETADPYSDALGMMDAKTEFYAHNESIVRARGSDVLELDLRTRDLPFVVTDRGLLVSQVASIAIVTDRVRWLGYQLTTIGDLMPAGRGGWLATDGDSVVVHFDATFRVDRTYPGAWHQVHLIDPGHVVSWDNEYRLVDLEDPANIPVVLPHASSFELERSTNLAVLHTNAAIAFMHYDPAAHAFGSDVVTEQVAWPVEVSLEDPANTGGIVAVIGTASQRDAKHVDVVVDQLQRVDPHHHELEVARHASATVSLHADPEFAAQADEEDGVLLSAMPKFLRVRNSPDGAFAAELGDGRVSVRSADGTLLWTHAAAGTRGLFWLSPDELLLFGQGIARIDARTGAPRARQCGSRFGIWDSQPTAAPGAGLCEAW